MHLQAEAVSNALTIEQDGVEELSIVPHVRLTCVEIELHFIAALHLCLDNLIKEAIDARVIVFLVDHIEANDQIGVPVSLNHCVDSCLDMVSAKDLESTDDEAHSKEGEPRLDFLDTFVEYFELLLQRDRIPVVVKDASNDVPVLYDSDHLLDKVSRHSVQDPLEERPVVVQIEAETELRFEFLPDVMVVANSTLWSEREFLL